MPIQDVQAITRIRVRTIFLVGVGVVLSSFSTALAVSPSIRSAVVSLIGGSQASTCALQVPAEFLPTATTFPSPATPTGAAADAPKPSTTDIPPPLNNPTLLTAQSQPEALGIVPPAVRGTGAQSDYTGTDFAAGELIVKLKTDALTDAVTSPKAKKTKVGTPRLSASAKATATLERYCAKQASRPFAKKSQHGLSRYVVFHSDAIRALGDKRRQKAATQAFAADLEKNNDGTVESVQLNWVLKTTALPNDT